MRDANLRESNESTRINVDFLLAKIREIRVDSRSS
jgi:hypothetical protein